MIEFTRITNNVNGNPRYVCHFLNLNTSQENTPEFWEEHGMNTISIKYALAIKRAHKLGGRKYHTKAYGGGIVFSFYESQEGFSKLIEDLVKKESEQ